MYAAGAWRFVQCNWGARHLVNAKEVPKPGIKGKTDSLRSVVTLRIIFLKMGKIFRENYNFKFDFRYEYDDHYFLTDPREFIYEFFPLQSEWQLLKSPITLQDFEELPFVRSLFFRYGLYFPDSNTKAVMHTDQSGNHNQRSKCFIIIIIKYGLSNSLYSNNLFLYFRCSHRKNSYALAHAVKLDISLQFKILRQRRGFVRWDFT